MSRTERKAIDKVLILLGVVAFAVLLAIGCISWYGYRFTTDTVRTELSAQKIYFPAPDSPAITSLPSADQKAVSQYAGQQLTNGEQAKVYADNFIAVHLREAAAGQTYAEVSAAAMQDPGNQQLQKQKATLFQGETLRGLLLGNGYAYWTLGMLAKCAAIVAFIGAGLMAVLICLGLARVNRQK